MEVYFHSTINTSNILLLYMSTGKYSTTRISRGSIVKWRDICFSSTLCIAVCLCGTVGESGYPFIFVYKKRRGAAHKQSTPQRHRVCKYRLVNRFLYRSARCSWVDNSPRVGCFKLKRREGGGEGGHQVFPILRTHTYAHFFARIEAVSTDVI